MRNLFVLALLFFSLVFAFADQHYVCTQSGDLDRWDVPTWKQDSVFSMGYTIYVDVYDSQKVTVMANDSNGTAKCICEKDTLNNCTIFCLPADMTDCRGNCICTYCDYVFNDFFDPDGTEVKNFINEFINRLIGIY